MYGPFIGAVLGALMYIFLVGAQLGNVEEKFDNGAIMPVSRPLGPQGHERPNWRNSELMQSQRGAQQGKPPPPEKKQKKAGGGFAFGKLADLGSKGFDVAQNFDASAFENPEFENAMETAQQAKSAYDQGKAVYDLGVEAHNFAKESYDAYRDQQSPPPRGQQRQGGRPVQSSSGNPYQPQRRW